MSLSASSPTTAKANPLRFSLRTLLELLTFAAIVSCALFSRELYRDESVFLLGFPPGLWVGRSIGRWRGRSGVLEAALGGGVGCAIASGLASECLPRQLDLAEYLAVSIPAGLLLGGIVAGCYWLLVDAPPSWRAWRKAILSIVVILGVAALAAWGYRRATDWSPRFEVANRFLDQQTHADSRRICAFSPQGNYLAWQRENTWYTTERKQIELFKIAGRRLQPVKLDALTPDVWSIVFAPDELSLAFLKERSPRMHVIDLQGRETHSAEVRSPDYHFLDNELTFSRDGREIFACWHTEHVRQWTAFARDTLQEQRSHSFAFTGRLFVSPSGKWLVKLHQKRSRTGWIDRSVPARAEIVATADLNVVREYEIRADLRVPPAGFLDGVPGTADQEHRFLAHVINEMFPDSKIRIALEGALQGQSVLTVRGYARDAEESQQIVTLIWSQVNGPTKALSDNAVERKPHLRVMSMLDDLSTGDRPLFDPEETCLAIGNRVLQLTGGAEQAADQRAVSELPGKVVGLLPRGRALVLVGSEPRFQTRIPFLRHWFPAEEQTRLCIVEIATGQTLRRSVPIRWGGSDFHLAQDGRTAAGFDFFGTLQIWDIPQVD